MIKKYISKFTIDIMPSIIATIVGAYIVNHYISPKSADAPAAATASVDLKPAAPAVVKASVKPTENTSDVASLPDAAAALPADKPATDLKTDTSSAAARRHQPTARERAAAEKAASEKAAAEKSALEKAASEKVAAEKAAAKPAATAAVTPAAPAPAAPSIASVLDAAPTPSPADANDLARAAIERLRNSGEAPRNDAQRTDGPRVQEAVRIQEAPRASVAPAPQQPAIQQLPPPIMVSTPTIETYGTQPLSGQPAYSDAPRSSDARDSRRPRPPGDIPLGPPLNIEADATGSTPRQNTTTVADDVLSAAKSVFHSVIPHQFDH